MKTALLINASPHGDFSHARQLAHEQLQRLRQRYPDLELIERNLSEQPLPPLDIEYGAALTKPTAFDAPVFDVSEALIQELERSDVVFVCTPMHNLTVPASLKLWIDYVLRIHRTFSSGPDGKTGLLASRPVYVLVGSGGFHQGPRAKQRDFLTDYLREVFTMLGLSDIHFVYLEGLVFGEEAVATALQNARQHLASFALFNESL